MIDLSTRYLGLDLTSPLVASASPLCENIADIRRMEDAGISAVVLPSLFEEQLRIESEGLDDDLSRTEGTFAEFLSAFPDLRDYNLGPEGYLELIRWAKQAVSIPVIGSLNGVSIGGWLRYAILMQEAGANAIELNLYNVVADPGLTSVRVEQDYCEVVAQVKSAVSIPVAVKLSPFFTSLPYFAQRLEEAGADALVLFNRFYQPEFDLEALEVAPNLTLSTSQELPLRLHWIAILSDQIRADLAVTGGVHTAEDVLKSMMAGARVAMMTSALLKHGVEYARTVIQHIQRWMEEHEYDSIKQMRGSMSRSSAPRATAFERVNYMRVLSSYVAR
jgi:dihydroorotate dehydrogenase (fumarate)